MELWNGTRLDDGMFGLLMEVEKKSGSAGVRSCFEEGARKPHANDAKPDLKSRFGYDVCVEISLATKAADTFKSSS